MEMIKQKWFFNDSIFSDGDVLRGETDCSPEWCGPQKVKLVALLSSFYKSFL